MTLLWAAYVAAVIDTDNQTQAYDRTGIAQSTIGRWLNSKKAPTEAAKVAAFAQGYERNVLEAFVAAGMLTEDVAAEGLPAGSREFLAKVRGDEGGSVSPLRSPKRPASPSSGRVAKTRDKAARKDRDPNT